MKVLIIDDQVDSAIKLKNLISSNIKSVENIEILSNAIEINNWLNLNEEPELIFSRTTIENENIISILKDQKIVCPIIFISSDDKQVLEALKLNCIDYIILPLSNDKVIRSLKKWKSIFEQSSFKNQFTTRVQNFKTRFLIKYGDTIQYKTVDEIAYFYADDKIVKLVTHEGRGFLIDYSLEALEKMLNPVFFYRINRKFITALNSIHTIKTVSSNRLQMYLKPKFETDIFISKEKSSSFKLWLEG